MRTFVERIKRYYKKGKYAKSDVADFLKVALITPLEYEYIVGTPYDPEKGE